ncbi:hypothetical protein [Amycolatopsis benzoatilytica]|nr:hypothetical protein [Amycolatopsis benzoatilytica]
MLNGRRTAAVASTMEPAVPGRPFPGPTGLACPVHCRNPPGAVWLLAET